MEGYSYPYPPPFPPIGPDCQFPDHGDGFGDYYGMGPIHEDKSHRRQSRSNATKTKRERNRLYGRSRSSVSDPSRSGSHSRSLSRSSWARHRCLNRSGSRRDLNMREPSFLDAFRVLYLTPGKHKNSTTKYLATKKRQDRIQEILKSDGLGSKRWMFYPRSRRDHATFEDAVKDDVTVPRECDQRVKVDGQFFRKYKRSKRVDKDAPIAKLKRWELIFYKKLGFIQAV